MRCSSCNFENAAGKKFCIHCGASLSPGCPKCGSKNPTDARFCGDCGAALVGTVSPDASRASAAGQTAQGIRVTPEQADPSLALEGERKTVTALFADIKGSTELIERLDPEEARAIIDPVLQLMMEAVHRYGGYIAQSTGDGIFALFGAPLAYEDHPQRALHAALAMQQTIRERASRLAAQGRPEIEARVGVNSGEVVVRTIETGGHTEYAPIGMTANLAARLQTVASSGSIAVSDTTRRLCEGYFSFCGLGPIKVKGLVEPVEAYEVTGVGPLRTHFQLAARRGLTQFLGRDRELAELKRALDLMRSSHGQVIATVAEAGTGKSRLVHEFKAILPPECKVLEAYSVSHGKAAAWLPALELLRGYFCIQDADEPPARRKKVRTTVSALDPALSDTLPYLLGLLGIQDTPDPLAQMDAQIRLRRTLAAIRRIIVRESLKQPLVVIFEDLHWVDEQTQALLDLIVDSIAGTRVLLLTNYRPEYRHQWSGKSHYTQLRLDPLGGESAAAMLTALLGDDAELETIKRLIAERTGGNPFFMEEMVQALFDQGALVRNGAMKVVPRLSQLRLPSTVQGVLASRIDQLSTSQKELLQTLAVVGRESPFGLIEQVVGAERTTLERNLDELRAAEFIYEQPALADVEYVFKHALTQEVAYSSLLLERRRATHDRVAKGIEVLYEGRLEQHVAELARHYRHANNIEKAVHYLRLAAGQAADRSALSEAESQLRDAIALLMALPASPERDLTELNLQTTLAALLSGRSWGAPEREPVLRRAYQLSERIADPQEVLPVLFQLGQFYIEQMRLAEARELGERAVVLAADVQHPTLEVGAWHNLAESCFWSGDLKLARAHARRSLALSENLQPEALIRSLGLDFWLITTFIIATTDLLCGLPDEATQWKRPVAERVVLNSHPLSKAFGMTASSIVALLLDDPTTLSELIAPARQICDKYGFHELSGWQKQFGAWISFRRGETALAITQMHEAIEEPRALGSFIMSTWRLVLLAEMQLEAGDIQSAEATAAEALGNLERTHEGWCEPEVYRVAAEVLLRKPEGDPSAAEEHLRRAIEIARGQGTKWWELRATVGLARLLASQGRRDEARTMLGEIYNWFTEGFDTADLKDAKALLDELSG
jgi:class 3 adenylate cyclase/tetratricopeptide (TPR) repeat protein